MVNRADILECSTRRIKNPNFQLSRYCDCSTGQVDKNPYLGRYPEMLNQTGKPKCLTEQVS